MPTNETAKEFRFYRSTHPTTILSHSPAGGASFAIDALRVF
jgi:hypothetical protein